VQTRTDTRTQIFQDPHISDKQTFLLAKLYLLYTRQNQSVGRPQMFLKVVGTCATKKWMG